MKVILKAYGPGPSYAEMKRIGDQMSDPRQNRMMLSDEQNKAVDQAYQFLKDGDKEKAREALLPVFEKVNIEEG